MKFKTTFLTLFLCYSLAITPLYAEIKVGTVFFKPPFVMSVGEGFDIDLIRELCHRMNEHCEVIPMDFHTLFSSLNSGKIDIAIGGIYISPVRLQNYIFSLPYMLSDAQFLILRSSKMQTINDLAGKNIGVIKTEEESSQGVFAAYLSETFKDKIKIKQYNDMEDLISALSNGNIAAAFLHKSTANYWRQNGGNQFQLLDKVIRLGYGIGIVALPKNSTLIMRINQTLQNMENDDSYLKLYNTYFSNE